LGRGKRFGLWERFAFDIENLRFARIMKESSFENKAIFCIWKMLVIIRHNTRYIVNFTDSAVMWVLRVRNDFWIRV